MKIYFENKYGKLRELGDVFTDKDIYDAIDVFCQNHNYEALYIRNWRDKDGNMVYDVGSHSEFFIVKE